MTWHALLWYAAVVAAAASLGLALAAFARAGARAPGLFRSPPADSPRASIVLRNAARKVGAIAILLMLASKCAGSH